VRYSALRVLAVIVLGIIIGNLISPPPLFLIIITFLGIAVFKFTKGFSLYLSLFSLVILNLYLHSPLDYKNLYYKETSFKGIVVETFLFSKGFYKYTVELKEVSDQRLKGSPKIFLYTNKSSLRYGDLISFKGKLLPLSYPKNPNLFDLEGYYQRRGIIGKIRLTSQDLMVIEEDKGNKVMGRIVLPMRDYFFNTINRYLSGKEASLLLGLLLGEKRGIPESTKETFVKAGVMHILAVSGLHIGIIVGILILLFNVLRIKPYFSLPILIMVIFLYSGITGFRPPVVRAGLMALFASLGFYLERKVIPLNSIFVAGIIILLFSPMALLEPSFQLSFSAVISILLLSEKIYNLFQPLNLPVLVKRYLILPFSVSIAAQIGVMPFLLYYFFRLPTLSVIANLIIIPLVGIALPLGFLLIIINPLSHLLASWIANTLSMALKLILLLTKELGAASFSTITTGKPPILLLGFIYALLFLLFNFKKRWVRKTLVYGGLIGFNLFIWKGIFKPQFLEVNFLDTYKGDVAVLRLPDHKTLLWYTGKIDDNLLTQFLRSKGIENPDLKLNYLRADTSWSLRNKELGFEVKVFSMNKKSSMLIQYRRCSFLFIGGLNYPERAEVLKLPYGKWERFEEIVERVKPRYVILPFMTSEFKQKLIRKGIEPLCPRTQGGITLRSDGEAIKIIKMRDRY